MLISLLVALLTPDHACVHTVNTPRPLLTRKEQAATRDLILRVVKDRRGAPAFAALLVLVASRESSLQRGLVHRLAQDLAGSFSAWRKMQTSYVDNAHAADAEKWQTYGLFGMNSNYFTLLWDKTADPRVLCDAVVDVLVYQRAALRTLVKIQKTGRCAPTWENIHAGVSGGKLCPDRDETDFRRRAAIVGLNPDAEVRAEDLGRPVEPAQQQAERARLHRMTGVLNFSPCRTPSCFAAAARWRSR